MGQKRSDIVSDDCMVGASPRRTVWLSRRWTRGDWARNAVAGSLSGKLAVLLTAAALIGGSVFWYVSITNDRRNLTDNALSFVSSFSEVLIRSIRDDMLFFRRDDIQRTIDSIGASEAIEKVRIVGTNGTVVCSSDKQEIGKWIARDSSACAGCHHVGRVAAGTRVGDRQWGIYRDHSGRRVLSFVEPIRNEPDCSASSCHAHDKSQQVLGVLMTDFSLAAIDAKIGRKTIETAFLIFIFLAGGLGGMYLVLWRFILKPVKSLSDGMEKVASGDLSQRVPVTTDDEVGRLSRTFNAMTGELITAREKNERWTQALEEEVRKKTDEIRKTQGKLIQSEKLAALGRLTADVAHEIRNPLTALGGYGRRLHRIASSPKEKEYAGIIVSEAHRLEQILRDILTFSREPKLSLVKVPVTGMVAECIVTFAALCEECAISIETDYGTNLPVLIDVNQARQAVNNLIANAIDVMPDGGVLSILTVSERMHEATFVAVHVSDTGTGIPEGSLSYVFEPFYTTKEIGRGTGLGLAISRKIVEEHGGFITARNRNGGGLTASLYFPYQSEADFSKIRCWEYMKCERNLGNAQKCPAYPNFGRVCWVVGGTFCEGKVQGTFAQKYNNCSSCAFFEQVTTGKL